MNNDFVYGCNLCNFSNFNSSNKAYRKGVILSELSESETIEASKRIAFFNNEVLICFKCGEEIGHKNLWKALLSLKELDDIDPSEEYEFSPDSTQCELDIAIDRGEFKAYNQDISDD